MLLACCLLLGMDTYGFQKDACVGKDCSRVLNINISLRNSLLFVMRSRLLIEFFRFRYV